MHSLAVPASVEPALLHSYRSDAGIVTMKPNAVTHRARRLVLLAFIAGGTIVTQELVSASASIIERSNQTDSMLVALTNAVNTVRGSLGRLAGAHNAEPGAIVRDFDAAFDQILERLDHRLTSTPSGGLDLAVIDIERRAFIQAVDTTPTQENSPYLATGWRAVDLQAQKLTGAILGQRELLEMTRARAILQAEMMVALSSGVALLMIAYFVWRPIIALRAALHYRRLITPLFG